MGSPVRGADLLAEGPWDVVVGDAGDLTEVEGGFGGEALLTAVLSQDLFCQTVFYGKGIGVSEAVDLMRGGACLVVSREESGLEGLAWAVEEAWSERLADVRLAMEHGLE